MNNSKDTFGLLERVLDAASPQKYAAAAFSSELVKLEDNIVDNRKTGDIHLLRRIENAYSIWQNIPFELRENIAELVRDGEEPSVAKERMAKAGTYIARKLALCEQNIPPHEFLKPENIRPFAAEVGKIDFLVEFLSNGIMARKKLPLRHEMTRAYTQKMYAQQLLTKNLDEVASLFLGEHYMPSSQFDLSPMDNSYVLFRSKNENPEKDGISLEFDIDHKTGSVNAHSDNLFGHEFSVDVTDSLDDPYAMAQKIREAGEREKPAMQPGMQM